MSAQMAGAGVQGAALAVACGASLAAALVLPRLARRAGWVDAAGRSARKLQRRPVPAVGGAICLAGLLAGWALLASQGRPGASLPGGGLAGLLGGVAGGGAALWPLGGVLAAFAVGLVDDLLPRGLGPRSKLAGQAAAGLVLGAPLLARGAEPGAALAVSLLALGAVVAANAVNTFDNADGAAGTLAALGCLGPAPLVTASLAPFLALNLARRRDGEVGAYLGDSGSHLLGLLILMTPPAWPVLALPLIDLLRLAVVRTRAGSAPWVGDRRHLAHRLLARGVPRLAVPAVLAGLALPTVLLGFAGVAPTAVLFALALRRTAGPRRPRAAPLGPAAAARVLP